MNTLKLIEIVNKADKDYALALVPADTLKKFAELIVLECCQFEKTYGGDAGLVARSFSRQIREHFGVEE